MQTNLLIVDNQNTVPSGKPGHSKRLDKGTIEGDREQGREETDFSSTLAEVANEQRSHPRTVDESGIDRKESGNGEAGSEDLKKDMHGEIESDGLEKGANEGLVKAVKTSGPFLVLNGKAGARSTDNERVAMGKELAGYGLKRGPGKLKVISKVVPGLDHKLSMDPDEANSSKADSAGLGMERKQGESGVEKVAVNPLGHLLKELGTASAGRERLSVVSGDRVEKLMGDPEKTAALKTDFSKAVPDLEKVKESSLKEQVGPKDLLKVSALLKELGTVSAGRERLSGVSGDRVEKLMGDPEKTAALKTDFSKAVPDLEKVKESSLKEQVGPKDLLKVSALLKELGTVSAGRERLSGVSGDRVEKLMGDPEKTAALKTDFSKAVPDLEKVKESSLKEPAGPKDLLKVSALLKEFGTVSAGRERLSGVSGDRVEKLMGDPEKTAALKTDFSRAVPDLEKVKESSLKEPVGPKDLLKVSALLKELGTASAGRERLSVVSGDRVEKLMGGPERTPVLKTDFSKAVPDLEKVKESSLKEPVGTNELLKVSALLKELGTASAGRERLSVVSGDRVEKLMGGPERTPVLKTDFSKAVPDLEKVKESSLKEPVGTNELLKVSALLKELGTASAGRERLSVVSGDRVEKLMGGPERTPVLKTDFSKAVPDLEKVKESSLKEQVGPKELLKVAVLLKELGTASAGRERLSVVSGDRVEKLMGDPDKTAVLKTDFSRAVPDLEKVKESSLKEPVGPKDLLKVAVLLRPYPELGTVSAGRERLSGVSGDRVEKLMGDPEKTAGLKTDFSKAVPDLEKVKESSLKEPAGPKELLKVSVLLKELGTASATKSNRTQRFALESQGFVKEGGHLKGFGEESGRINRGVHDKEPAAQKLWMGSMKGFSEEFAQKGSGIEGSAPRLGIEPKDARSETVKGKVLVEGNLPHKKVEKTESNSSENTNLSSRNYSTPDKGTGAVSHSKEPQVFTKSDQANTLRQVVNKVVFNLGNGRSEFKIDLKPESLGHLKMQILTENHHVTVRIVAENPLVKEMIEGNLAQLKANFQNQGLEIEKFDVSVAQDSNKNGAGGGRYDSEKMGKKSGDTGNGYGGTAEESEEIDASTRKAQGEGAVNFFA